MAKAKTATAEKKDYQVLIEPVITEKSSVVGNEGNRVAFKVDKKATKTEIKNAVERIFDVKVSGVNTCNFLGKKKKTTGLYGRTAHWKKAYVTLQEGHTIDIVEGL